MYNFFMKNDNFLLKVDISKLRKIAPVGDYILALDFGGTMVKYAIFNLKDLSESITFGEFKTFFYSADFVKTFRSEITHLLSNQNLKLNDIAYCALSWGGPMYKGNQEVYGNNKLNTPDRFNVAKALTEVFAPHKLLISCLNDARSAIFGEYCYYYANTHANKIVLGYTVGTHVGGCIIQSGKILNGDHNHAAEFGHGSNLNESNIWCYCGLQGCMGAHSSGPGTKILLKEDICRHASPLSDLRTKLDRDLTLKDLCVFIGETNNFYAKMFLRKIMKSLANSIAYTIYCFDPSLIIIGGTPTLAGKVLYDAIYDNLVSIILPDYLNETEIKFAHLLEKANCYGVVFYGLESNGLLIK